LSFKDPEHEKWSFMMDYFINQPDNEPSCMSSRMKTFSTAGLISGICYIATSEILDTYIDHADYTDADDVRIRKNIVNTICAGSIGIASYSLIKRLRSHRYIHKHFINFISHWNTTYKAYTPEKLYTLCAQEYASYVNNPDVFKQTCHDETIRCITTCAREYKKKHSQNSIFDRTRLSKLASWGSYALSYII
jgi:hypothetical protein